jgi:NAD(P)-dependent dehydrogenase (short-subunit alcohol dehydrogenase family)
MGTSKTILITGARGGIGLESAQLLAARGHRVIATVHHDKDIAVVEAAAEQRGVQLTVAKLNLLNEKDREQVLGYDVDVLINNAAIGESGPLIEVPIERIRKNFETNVFATLELSQRYAQGRYGKGPCRIIFISSLAGRLAMPFMGPYVMTKFALEGAIDALRIELRPLKIQVSLVEPGAYATGFNEKMHARKYEWLDGDSLYHDHRSYIEFFERANYRLQGEDIGRIALKVVKAVEARRPAARYSAPWWQAVGVQFMRMLGK